MEEEWWKWKDGVWIVRETHGTKGEVFVVCTMDEFLKWRSELCVNECE